MLQQISKVTKVIGSHYDEYRSAVRHEEVQETPEVDYRQVMFKEVKELQAEGLQHRPDIQEAGYCQTDRKEIYGLRHSSEKGRQGAIALLSLRHICGRRVSAW